MEKLVGRWFKLPMWGRWVSGIGAWVVLMAIGPAVREKSIQGFFLNIGSVVIYAAIAISSFALAFWTGFKVVEKTKLPWIGIVVGILIFFLTATVGKELQEYLGVSNRMGFIENYK